MAAANAEQVYPEELATALAAEFPQLKERGRSVAYMDTVGSVLYTKSLLEAVVEDLSANVYSNPHSCAVTRKGKKSLESVFNICMTLISTGHA